MRLAAILLSLALVGCTSGTLSTAHEGTAYAVSKEKAKEIVDTSMLTFLSYDYINPAPPGMSAIACSGYIRSIIDTTTINATAVPMSGLGPDGKTREGYAFGVRYDGTIFNPQAPRKIYDYMKERAAVSGQLLRVK